jgi:hypothetical protein
MRLNFRSIPINPSEIVNTNIRLIIKIRADRALIIGYYPIKRQLMGFLSADVCSRHRKEMCLWVDLGGEAAKINP